MLLWNRNLSFHRKWSLREHQQKTWPNTDGYNYQSNQNNMGSGEKWQQQFNCCSKHKQLGLSVKHITTTPSPPAPNSGVEDMETSASCPQKSHHTTSVVYISFIILRKKYKVWATSCCSGRLAYLTERISCLFPLILRRMNPTWCHHSTWLKILLFVNADIEEGTSSRVQKKYVPPGPTHTSLLAWCLTPSVIVKEDGDTYFGILFSWLTVFF